ncbi:MAG: hypothetical protein JXN63_01875 [Candidatus Delongbacteria bacterium]|nr:hypothetical protein [Candidatus Delongbacteria bacterium]
MKTIKAMMLILIFAFSFAAEDVLKGQGGPDSFGYKWIDSNESGGPVFDWIDISTVGTSIYLQDEIVQGPYNLGFSFDFYGVVYNSVYVGSNGYISFSSYLSDYENTIMPFSTNPNNSVYAFWDDLNPPGNNAYYYYDAANGRFIVQYEAVPVFGETNTNTFQIILYPDDTMLIQYKEMNGTLNSCTVGIENDDASTGLQVAYNEVYIADSLAVQIYPGDVVYGGEIFVSETSIDFGYIEVGESSTLQFYVANNSLTEKMSCDIFTPANFTIAGAAKNTVHFSLDFQDSMFFDLTFNAPAEQQYSGYVVIDSSDSTSTPDSIYVQGSGSYPNINLSVQDTLNASVIYQGSKQSYFNILNEGYAKLVYSTRVAEVVKSPEKGSGGPDTYGYTWKDSDDPAGPAYNWFDISSLGTALTCGDESVNESINIGFSFPFYGNNYSTLNVISNGYLSFTSSVVLYNNASIPNSAEPNNLISPFWHDLDPGSFGNIYHYYDTVFERFIVQYDNVPTYGQPTGNTFQIILYHDGSVVFQYKQLDPSSLTYSSVGIENSTGTVGTRICYNEPYLKNGLAVEITPPAEGWINLMPKRGEIAGQAQQQIAVSFDASELSVGTYEANIYVDSNDPDTETLTLPVKLNVYQLTTPANVATSVSGTTLTLSWDAVPFASSYKIYSSDDPYGTFLVDNNGAFAGNSWSTSIANAKKFYRVTALDAKGKVIE